MKCVIFLVATTIICIIGITTSAVRQRRGYYGHPYQHTNTHTHWWREYEVNNRRVQPSGPYDAFGINYADFEGSDGENRPIIEPKPLPGSINRGNINWLRPWGVSTTEKPLPDPFPLSTEKSLKQIALCIGSCSITTEYNPVCGSNNVTYINPGQLECAQKCGVDVELSRLSACSVQISTNPGFHISMEVFVVCIRQCPMTTEYNPVCGSNNVTYTNPGRLICEQNCGVPVELSKLSPCTGPEPAATQKTEEQISACIRSCPVTTEYNPVCGSNNVTYTNVGRFECAQNCGVEVYLSRQTSCEVPVTKDISPVNATRDFNMTSNDITEINLIRPTNSTTVRPFINKNGNNSSGWENTDKKANNSNDSNNVSNINDPDNATNYFNHQKFGNHNDRDNNLNISSISGANDVSKDDNSANDKNSINGKNDNYDGSYNNVAYEKENGSPETKGYHSSDGHYGGNFGHGGNNYNGGHGGYNGNHGHHSGNNNCNVGNNQKTPNVQEVMACMQLCSLSSEYNPVCGTDNITYMNPGRLLCAQFCGIEVRAKKFAPCFSTSNINFHCPTICTNAPATESPGTNTPPSPSIQDCIDTCPASTEFKPVCGSNNITYRNLEKMQCARRCGIDVTLLRNSHCSGPNAAYSNGSNSNPPISNRTETNSSLQAFQECIKQCSVPQNYEPICGSDDVTYNNTGHLICVRQCGHDVRVKQLSPCPKDEFPSTNPTTEKEPASPNPNRLNFTIPLDVLDSIWSVTTTAKDESEEFDLDQRVKD